MSIDRQYDSYLEKNGIVETIEVIPDHPCQVFPAPAPLVHGLEEAVAVASALLDSPGETSVGDLDIQT